MDSFHFAGTEPARQSLQEIRMTPPAFLTQTEMSLMNDGDAVGGLTFDDLRELPMHMQLGLDLTALD